MADKQIAQVLREQMEYHYQEYIKVKNALEAYEGKPTDKPDKEVPKAQKTRPERNFREKVLAIFEKKQTPLFAQELVKEFSDIGDTIDYNNVNSRVTELTNKGVLTKLPSNLRKRGKRTYIVPKSWIENGVLKSEYRAKIEQAK